jgi:predicted AlkP superfamily pyrophosphatase or phosphodiesterase
MTVNSPFRPRVWTSIVLTALGLALAARLTARAAQQPVQPSAPATTAAHVVLISIDGLKPDYYLGKGANPPDTPTLTALRNRGSWAEAVQAQYPSLTYVGHTSLATGLRPIRHGIVQNTMFDPASGGSSMWYFNASSLKRPALWDAVGGAGLTTAAVSWPVTVGARITYLFPESNQAPRDSTWLDLARRESTPGLVDAVVQRLGGFGPNDNRDPIQRDRFAGAAASQIIETWRPNLLLVHLVEADYAQHDHGPWSPESKAAMERIDRHIGEIVKSAERAGIADRTVFIISGDHGFYPVNAAFQPNVILKNAGLIDVDGSGRVTGWRAIAHRSAIRLKDPSDTVVANRVVKLFRDLADGPYQGLLRIVGGDEIARLGGDPDVLLILEPSPGYTTTAGFNGEPLERTDKKGDHGYLPTEREMYTGLILSGPGVREGIAMPIARQIDVAPTAARLLGVEMADVDGAAMIGVLDPIQRRLPVSGGR